jgi:DNA-binding MarR family transcriptional regulator
LQAFDLAADSADVGARRNGGLSTVGELDELARRNFDPDPTGEFPFDATVYAFHLLVALARTRDAQLERLLRPTGVTLAHHRALTVVIRFGPCSMSELADFSAVDRTTLTRTVDQLVGAGYVERGMSPTDRRQVLLTITPAGQEAAARARDMVAAHNREALEGVDPADLRGMVRAQQQIITNLAGSPDMAHRLLNLTRSEKDAQAAANDGR